ncbi:hypothetical protein NONI108955_43370 [Nocardia ninae]|uniref:DUF2637 domain-containing protein n=1 Tax=Nocardia ninae NBRC 108245 TaxID=1210091 RepID=A0A511M9V0_9NOCA|nr:hypothetical protein [Nocardia ninae]GEM37369.1 hypothetical protein NN4_18880 [Nocardia ninae NBRC 108245]
MTSIAELVPRKRTKHAPYDPFGPDLNLDKLLLDAQSRVATQHSEALTEARSNDEIRRRREVADEIRGLDIEDELAGARARYATAQSSRRAAERRHRRMVTEAEWHADAVAARQRATSESAQIADTHRTSTWISRALIGVIAAGVVWGAVNVQHNMTTGVPMSDPRFWLAFLYEPLVTIPLIVVMVTAATAARRGRPVNKRQIISLEVGLLLLTLVLNVGPHVMSANWHTAIEYGVAPIMIAAVVWLHSWTSGTFADLIAIGPSTDTDVAEVRPTDLVAVDTAA